MIDEFSKYKARKDLTKEYYEKIGKALLKKEEGSIRKSNSLKEKAVNLGLDIVRLEKVDESEEFIQESHLRFLSRCRLLEIDHYIIEGFIGAGQRGAVYNASDLNKDRKAALKVLFYPRNREERERFVREGNVTFEINSPYLVSGYEPTKKITGAPIYWYSMEVLNNAVPFSDYLGRSGLDDAVSKLSQVCQGLSHLHKENIVHRDLHAENIVITNNGTPKIFDFGSIPVVGHDYTFRPVGSLKVSSPEKLNNPSSVDPPTDMFSVGCIAYFAISDRWPLYGGNFGEKVQLLRECDPEPLQTEREALAQLVDDLLEKEPADRPTASEAASRFSELAESL